MFIQICEEMLIQICQDEIRVTEIILHTIIKLSDTTIYLDKVIVYKFMLNTYNNKTIWLRIHWIKLYVNYNLEITLDNDNFM